MYVLGTAGHVDHGKSSLVKALTGIDPDRWEEEKRREMTIDLGFAWLTLPSGRQVSLIDVPGHERFIKNMLAGVGGLDAALLVIAADESLMPQTTEHLAILDLLGVSHGVVALSKSDLVDADWLELVADEVRERLTGTSLAEAELVAVSARSGAGLAELRAAIDRMLDQTPPRANVAGAPRLPIDRAFTIGGFGTVVTGTLLDGPLSLGQEMEILPAGLRARVRGLQMHQQKVETVGPGSRVAVNLAGVHHSDLRRGDLLTTPDSLRPTQLIDVQIRVLPTAPQPLTQNMALDLFIGATETPCRITPLDRESLEPGSSGWVQLRLMTPIAAIRGDRLILRIPSPSLTVAGGTIVDVHPPRHRRFRADVISALETRARGEPADLLAQALGDGPPQLWEQLRTAADLPSGVDRAALAQLLHEQRAILLCEQDSPEPDADGLPKMLGNCAVVSGEGWTALEKKLLPALRAFHGRFPLRPGMPREELRRRLRIEPRALGPTLAEGVRRGLIGLGEATVSLADHEAQPTAAQRRELENTLAAMGRSPYSPPQPDLDEELSAWAMERRMFIRVAEDVYFLPRTYDELLAWVRETITSTGAVSVGQFRDRFGSSRKYALAFLEHLDERKITRREGEGRVLV